MYKITSEIKSKKSRRALRGEDTRPDSTRCFAAIMPQLVATLPQPAEGIRLDFVPQLVATLPQPISWSIWLKRAFKLLF